MVKERKVMKIRKRDKGSKVVLGITLIFLSVLIAVPAMGGPAKELSLLIVSHFVPPFETEVEAQAQQWMKERPDVKVTIDWVGTEEQAATLLAEAESGTGHDIVNLESFDYALFKRSLLPLDDVAEELAAENGGWTQAKREIGYVDGHWVACPWFIHTFVAVYRTDYFQQIGVDREMGSRSTWDDMLVWAKKLAAIDHPIGIPVGSNNDSDCSVGPLLWSFGGATVNREGEVTIDSPETVAALEYSKKLFQYMPKAVFGWTAGGDNNRFILSGYGSWTMNPPSIYASALKSLPDVAKYLDHVRTPAGPAGRFRSGSVWSLAVWNYSPNPELAREFIKFLMRKDNWYAQLVASEGYNQPVLKDYQDHPIWRDRKSLNQYEPMEETLHMMGWKYGPSAAGKKTFNLHIVPIMFAKATTDGVQAAIEWAETELKTLWKEELRR